MTCEYRGLQGVTGGYKRLQGTSSPGRFSLAFKAREKRPGDEVGLQGVTRGYKGLQRVTRGDRG